MSGYPSSVAQVLDPPVRFKRSTLCAVQQFASSRPWQGSIDERMAKFQQLHNDLCRVYAKHTSLRFGSINGVCSGGSCYDPMADTIVLNGKLSVVTYLHEFAHGLGKDEYGACRWSLNLFRACFPRSFGRCRAQGHMLRRG